MDMAVALSARLLLGKRYQLLEIVLAGDELVPQLALAGAAHGGPELERTHFIESRRGREQRQFSVRPEPQPYWLGQALTVSSALEHPGGYKNVVPIRCLKNAGLKPEMKIPASSLI